MSDQRSRNLTLASIAHLANQGHITPMHAKRIRAKAMGAIKPVRAPSFGSFSPPKIPKPVASIVPPSSSMPSMPGPAAGEGELPWQAP